MHAQTGLRIRAAAIAAAAAVMTFACASMAQAATTVADPDEPGFAQDVDIESASSSWWGPPGNVIITHTIRTYGAYTYPPCVVIVTDRHTRYSACDLVLYGPSRAIIGVKQTYDTITYTLNSSQIGNPRYYRWQGAAGGLNGDRTVWTREDLPRLPYATGEIDPPFDEPIDPPDLP